MWVQVVGALGVAFTGLGLTTSSRMALAEDGGTSHIRLRGSLRFDARATKDGGALLLNGTVVDDAHQPVQGESVIATIARTSSPGSPIALPAPEACRGSKTTAHLRGQSVAVTTGNGGAFCLRFSLPVDAYVVHLSTGNTELYDGAKAELGCDLARSSVTLAFDPPPRVIPADERASTIVAIARHEDDGASRPAPDLPVTLTNEAGALLGTATTDAEGRARWTLPRESLGPVGRGVLRVSFAGDDGRAPSSSDVDVERHARVDLVLRGATEGWLPAAVAEEGVPLSVTATQDLPGTPTGTVEALLGGAVVGAAPLREGRADLVATFDLRTGNQARLAIRYVPDAPWREAGEDVVAQMPLKHQTLSRNGPILMAGLGVAAWVALGRVRFRFRPGPRRKPGPASSPAADVQVLSPGASEGTGLRGRVIDAHDGRPVPGATLVVTRPGFEEAKAVTRATSTEGGIFALEASDVRRGDELVVLAPFHSTLRTTVPTPPRGELLVRLVTRKRTLLEGLVAWARRRGRPFDTRPEPTPGHVAQAAASDASVAQWARAVESAAFGTSPLDEKDERRILAMEPSALPRGTGGSTDPEVVREGSEEGGEDDDEEAPDCPSGIR